MTDTYEREDRRTLCEKFGHRFKERKREEVRWTDKEIESEEVDVPKGYLFGVSVKETRFSRRKVKHGYDYVTYECSREGCEAVVTREENEF